MNATPLGMKDDDPLPMDVDRIAPSTFVADVVMKQTITPFLQAAIDKGCTIQVGQDMLFEQIPAYLEFFGFGSHHPGRITRRFADSRLSGWHPSGAGSWRWAAAPSCCSPG